MRLRAGVAPRRYDRSAGVGNKGLSCVSRRVPCVRVAFGYGLSCASMASAAARVLARSLKREVYCDIDLNSTEKWMGDATCSNAAHERHICLHIVVCMQAWQ